MLRLVQLVFDVVQLFLRVIHKFVSFVKLSRVFICWQACGLFETTHPIDKTVVLNYFDFKQSAPDLHTLVPQHKWLLDLNRGPEFTHEVCNEEGSVLVPFDLSVITRDRNISYPNIVLQAPAHGYQVFSHDMHYF